MTIREKLNKIIFETDTRAGKNFDIVLLWVILFSVLTVMLESIPEIGSTHAKLFLAIEYAFTFLFTIEFIVRLYISPKPIAYLISFWGIIDFLSILPTYVGLFYVGYHYLLVVRIFRLLRVFRILKLARFNSESKVLIEALKASSYKVSLFLLVVFAITILMGTIMYVIEGGEKGFTSIPQSVYWAIVTITTVGYGDIVPQTVIGKMMSSFIMMLGYAIIAVPTGIVTVEIANANKRKEPCPNCGFSLNYNVNYCSNCGISLTQKT